MSTLERRRSLIVPSNVCLYFDRTIVLGPKGEDACLLLFGVCVCVVHHILTTVLTTSAGGVCFISCRFISTLGPSIAWSTLRVYTLVASFLQLSA